MKVNSMCASSLCKNTATEMQDLLKFAFIDAKECTKADIFRLTMTYVLQVQLSTLSIEACGPVSHYDPKWMAMTVGNSFSSYEQSLPLI